MSEFFHDSLEKIKTGLTEVYEESQQQARVSTLPWTSEHMLKLDQNVVLVGGLASSPYVYQQLKAWATTQGMSITRPDGPT
jgi:hypothetical protein